LNGRINNETFFDNLLVKIAQDAGVEDKGCWCGDFVAKTGINFKFHSAVLKGVANLEICG